MELKRIFIVGCPRSGTTLTQALVMSNDLIYSRAEDRGLVYLTRLCGGVSEKRKLLQCLVSSYSATRCFSARQGKFSPVLAKNWKVGLEKYFDVVDRETVRQNKNGWLLKDPNLLNRIKWVTQVLPTGRFIHTVRDPVDNVASIVEWGQLNKRKLDKLKLEANFDWAFDHWQQCFMESLSFLGRENHLHLYYDHVVEDPNRALQAISKFVGLPYGIIEDVDLGKYYNGIVQPWELWKEKNRNKGVVATNRIKASKLLGSDDLIRLRSRLKELCRSLDIIRELSDRQTNI